VEEVRYMISDAAKQVEVESHVLRYWQKELDLPISRNEMEQRYYKESDIEMLRRVKHLKEQGFQLKAIKMILSNRNQLDMADTDPFTVNVKNPEDNRMELLSESRSFQDEHSMDKPAGLSEETSLVRDEESQEIKGEPGAKLGQFMALMNRMIQDALRENNGILSDEISVNVTDGVISQMNYLMRIQEEKEEERFRKFDATLRDYQKSKLLSAATTDKNRRKSKFLQKNKLHI